MAELLGDSFKLFYDTATNFGTPTWAEQASIGDLSYDTAPEKVEIPKRIAFKVYKKGRSDLMFKFTSNYDATNTFHTALIGAINAGTKLHLAVAPGAIAGGGYWHMMAMITGPVDASLDNPATIEVECSPHADDSNIPAFVAFA